MGEMQSVLLNQGVSYDPTIADSIEVVLYEATAPYSIVASDSAVLHTNGTAHCVFPALNGNYYIGIRHRNALFTWSAQPVSISSSTVASYDFTNAANKAYGDNQIEVETGIFAIFSGDLNADENVDLFDVLQVENDITNFVYGYASTDLNGDGNVDLFDTLPLELNLLNFVYSIHP